jgi:hypothetical protein
VFTKASTHKVSGLHKEVLVGDNGHSKNRNIIIYITQTGFGIRLPLAI